MPALVACWWQRSFLNAFVPVALIFEAVQV